MKESIESIIQQSYKNIELIICDNASDDKTEQICSRFTKKDKRIIYYKQKKNYGAAKNYNDAFFLSNGKYFKWHTHDDICRKSFIEKCLDILEQDEQIALCFPKTIYIDDLGKQIKKNDNKLHFSSNNTIKRMYSFEKNISLCNASLGLIRSDILRKTDLIGKYIGSDEILLFKICLLGKIYLIDEKLFLRRDHSKNVRKLPLKERAKWF